MNWQAANAQAGQPDGAVHAAAPWLSSGVLNGNEAMKEKRAAKEKEVADVVAASEAALPPGCAIANWKKIRQDWEDIRHRAELGTAGKY